MKKMIGIAVALVVVFAVTRRFGPALRDRAMAKCQEMFDRRREDFRPKRLVQDIEEIGEQKEPVAVAG